MPFVMLPVPEEHLLNVMQYVVRLGKRGSLDPWDRESIDAAYAEVDLPTRRLLTFIAQANLDDKQITGEEAANTLGLDSEKVMGIAMGVGMLAQDGNHPQLFESRSGSAPDGQPVLVMTEEVARLVLAAAAADQGDE